MGIRRLLVLAFWLAAAFLVATQVVGPLVHGARGESVFVHIALGFFVGSLVWLAFRLAGEGRIRIAKPPRADNPFTARRRPRAKPADAKPAAPPKA
jgi:hypothetical protein